MKRFLIAITVVLTMASTCALAHVERLSIVATTYPQYDWIKTIMGEKVKDADITLFTQGGSDLHSYQPTAKDMITISTCDLIVYVGGQSDFWVEDVLNNAQNNEVKAVSMMGLVEIAQEEHVDGMQHEHEHDHEHEHEDEEIEYDEHVWLSIRNAKEICIGIANALSEVDPDSGDIYMNNALDYIEKLDALDAKYSDMVISAKRNRLLFADRFPFIYLTRDYSIDYYAAFAGCSAETEASFETVAFLAAKLDEEEIPVVLVMENSDRAIAETVISCTRDKNQQIMELNSMQSAKDSSVSYFSIMENNLAVLTIALN